MQLDTQPNLLRKGNLPACRSRRIGFTNLESGLLLYCNQFICTPSAWCEATPTAMFPSVAYWLFINNNVGQQITHLEPGLCIMCMYNMQNLCMSL